MNVTMFETEQQEAGGWRDLGMVEGKKGGQYSRQDNGELRGKVAWGDVGKETESELTQSAMESH